MARAFDPAREQYCSVESNLGITGPPFWISAWVYKNAPTPEAVVWLGDNSETKVCYMLWLDTSQKAVAVVQESRYVGEGVWSTTSGSINTWHHLCAVFAATNDRRIYLDAGGKNTSARDLSPKDLNRTTIGREDGASPGSYTNGSWAEVAFGTGAPTDDEVAALAAGFDPRLVFPRSRIRAFWPPLRDDKALCGNYTLTPYHAPDWSDHLSVFRPVRPGGGNVAPRPAGVPWHLFFGRAA